MFKYSYLLIFAFASLVPAQLCAGSIERTPIEPLLKSKWGQQAPFNFSTPMIDGYHAKTGCVATALAQVIYFYKYPYQGKQGVYTNTGSTGDFSFDFSSNTFDYDLMKEKYDLNTPDNDPSALEASKLMLAAGVTVDMNYGISSSSGTFSRIPAALSEWFLYPADGMGQLSKEYFTTQEWEDVIYEELAAGRPVIYLGGNGVSSHVFVCDGYRDGKFHMNWGWYGEKNDYHSLSNLQVERVADGSILSVNSLQRIVRGIRLDSHSNPGPLATASSFGYDPDSKNFSAVSISCFSDNTDIVPGVKVTDLSGNTVKTLWASAGATIHRRNSNLEFTTDLDGLDDGTYCIRPVYRLVSDISATPEIHNIYCNILNTRYYVVEISGNEIIKAEGKTDMVVNVDISDYYQYSSFIKNEIYNSGFSIFAENNGNTNITRFGVRLCKPGETEALKYTSYPESLAPGESKTIALGIPTADPGEYDMIIYDNTSNTLLGNPIRIIIHDGKKITAINNSPFRYMPLSEEKKEATILYPKTSVIEDNGFVEMAISPSVSIEGTEYKITEIGPRLLYNRKDVNKVIIPENVNKIDPSAFAGCSNLSEIKVDAPLPPIIHPSAFDAETLNSAHIIVPEGSVDLYKEAPVWSEFTYNDDSGDSPEEPLAESLMMQSFTIEPDKTADTVMILNTENEYYGCQFDLILPEGLSIVTGGIMVTEELKERNFSAGISDVKDDNSHTVVVYSSEDSIFPVGSNPILVFSFYASEDFNGGTITISNIIFSEAGENNKDRDVDFENTSCEVTADQTTYIEDFSDIEEVRIDIYDVSGIKVGDHIGTMEALNQLKPGLYIIKHRGKTHKFLKR